MSGQRGSRDTSRRDAHQELLAQALCEQTAVVVTRVSGSLKWYHLVHEGRFDQSWCGRPAAEWIGVHPDTQVRPERVCMPCLEAAYRAWGDSVPLDAAAMADEINRQVATVVARHGRTPRQRAS